MAFFAICLQHIAICQTDTTKTKDNDYQFIKYVNGNKHIDIDQLGLSPNMTVADFLQLFPEIMTRGSKEVMNNYSISMDGYTFSVEGNEVLNQTTIGELSSIIISDKPSVAYAQNGIGGVITLVPLEKKDGLHGNAQLDLTTSQTLQYSTDVNYKKNKLTVHSYLKGEMNGTTTTEDYYTYYNDQLLFNRTSTNSNRNIVELAKIGILYAISPRDNISVSAWQMYSNKRNQDYHVQTIDTTKYITRYDSTISNNHNILATFQYTHTFKHNGILNVVVDYNFNSDKTHQINKDTISAYSRPMESNNEIQYAGTLFSHNLHSMTLVVGNATTYSNNQNQPKAAIQYASVNVRPYTELSYIYSSKLQITAGFSYNYQYFHNYQSQTSINSHNYMVKADITYTPSSHHAIIAGCTRNWLPITGGECPGNIFSSNITYVFNNTYHQHHINLSVGMQYDRAHLYSGNNYNIFSPKLSLLWGYKWFFLSLSGQLFDNIAFHQYQYEDYHAYYNLRITPMFILPRSWMISATLMYNSCMLSMNHIQGDYFLTTLRLSKQIDQWFVHFELADPIHYPSKDITWNFRSGDDIIHTDRIYHLYSRHIRIGISYMF